MSRRKWISTFVTMLALAAATSASAGEPRQVFKKGTVYSVDELPDSAFRKKLKALPEPALKHALSTLQKMTFEAGEIANLHVGPSGGVHFICPMSANGKAFLRALGNGVAARAEPEIAAAPVPITNPPVYHSRPGCPRVIYLDFNGHTVENTRWNTDYNTARFEALPFDIDTLPNTFSDAEQTAIKRIWKRVAEDFAPFDVDVTTEEPAVMTSTTCRVLITPGTSRNNVVNPGSADGAVGIAYLAVFGDADYVARSQPVWVYSDLQGNREDFISETVSHEVGHNLALRHDGRTNPAEEYYEGHGAADSPTSWGPIMGISDRRNVTQWTRGEYALATNTQDDLAVMSGYLGFRTDDHGNDNATATALKLQNGIVFSSTTPEEDPANSQPANKGVIETTGDVDVFKFSTGAGFISLTARPLVMEANTRGGNIDIRLELRNFNGDVMATSDDNTDETIAGIYFNAPAGNYFLYVDGVGSGQPLNNPPSGYTEYASLGQYFLSGSIQPVVPDQGLPTARLNNVRMTTPGGATLDFNVTYFDSNGIANSTLDSNDIRITGPNGYDQPATFVRVSGTIPRIVTYRMTAPGGTFDSADNGTYNVNLQANQVANVLGLFANPGVIGTISIAINSGVPVANDDAVSTPDGQPVTVNVLANDVSNDPPFVIRILTPPQHGTAVVNADNSITYSPTPGYAGPDSLVYGLLDTEIESDIATLSITVLAQAPVITSPLMVSALDGIQFTYQITFTGTQPIQIAASNLPPGTSLIGSTIIGFIPPGSYAMTITATNATGSDTRTVVINGSVKLPNTDADGDGFSDEMELALGSDPVNAGSTPLTTLNGGAVPQNAGPLPFAQSRVGITVKLNFNSTRSNRDSIALNGTLPIPSDYGVILQPFAVFVGGAGVSGTLDFRGQFTSADKLFKFKVGKIKADIVGRNAPFTVQMKGVYADLLADEGFHNTDAKNTKVNLPVYVILGTRYYGIVMPALYSAKAGKSGSAKTTK
jgi:hypothetical protein